MKKRTNWNENKSKINQVPLTSCFYLDLRGSYKITRRGRSVLCSSTIAWGAENYFPSTFHENNPQNIPSFITNFNFHNSILYSNSIRSINIINFNCSDIGLCSLLCLSQYYCFLFRRSLSNNALRATMFFASSSHSHENVNGIVFVLSYFRIPSEGSESWHSIIRICFFSMLF